MSRIAVLGTGYVGLTSGACFAHLGHDVVCSDVVESKVDALSRGEIPMLEPRLDELVREGVAGGRLRFVLGNAAAAEDCEFAFMCVPTPQGPDGSADLSYIESAARDIADVLPQESIVVNKSTVPVGSTRVVERVLQRPDVRVVSNPEFLREGSAVHDFLHPDRIVIGSEDQASAIRVSALYLGVQAPTIVTDPATAETIKYASNAFHAAKVSFVNAVAAVCEAVGADVNEVVLGMGYDHRIGFDFLRPGPGWGGSCFGKDTRALIHTARRGGYDFGLLQGVVDVNEQQFDRIAAKVANAAGGSLDGVQVAVWGLTFKANTDDLRDSPSIEIVRRLLAAGATVTAYDPSVPPGREARELDGLDVDLRADAFAACDGAAVLAVLTEWEEFRFTDLDKVKEAMATPVVVDARNLLDRTALTRRGFVYQGVGRP